MPQIKPKVTQYTLYRSRAKTDDPATVLKSSHLATAEVFPCSIPNLGPLLLLTHTPKTPLWLTKISQLFGVKGLEDRTFKLQGGCIFVQTPDATYCACFGHGHLMLDTEKFEYEFGHRVSVNLVSAKSLSDLSLSTPGELSTSRQIHAAKPTRALDFNVHQARDLLRQVAGKVDDKTIAERVAGTAGLRLATKVEIKDLPSLCVRLEPYFQSADLSRLGITTQLMPVKNKALVAELFQTVQELFVHPPTQIFFLAPPDSVDFLDSTYELSFAGETYECSGLEIPAEVLQALQSSTSVVETLKKAKLKVKSLEDETQKKSWSALRCLSLEVSHDNRLYILLHGKFFEVDKAFAEAIEEQFNAMIIPGTTIPCKYQYEEGMKGPDELSFNSLVRQSLHGSESPTHLLDQLNISLTESQKVEFCDIAQDYRGRLKVYHTKIIKGGYSDISHECRQAVGGMQIYLTKIDFRNELKRRLVECVDEDGGIYRKKRKNVEIFDDYVRVEGGLIERLTEAVDDPPKRNSLDIIMILVNLNRPTESSRANLPFFAKLSLCDAFDTATALGVTLGVVFPEIEKSD